MKSLFILIFLCFCSLVQGQQTDTLTFYSEAFGRERTIYVKTPDFFKYQSPKAKLPIIYVLDGQHEWFVNPVLSSIEYLQYTKEIPQLLTVVIPHLDRVEECAIPKEGQAVLPLHTFLTKEVPKQIEAYHPAGQQILIGHSFSASFALYSYNLAPSFYTAVLSNTPLDRLERCLQELNKNGRSLARVYLSVGSPLSSKDAYHRASYDRLKAKYPQLFAAMHLFEAEHSTHNAVPIIAVPHFLSELFLDYSTRYDAIAPVDQNYALLEEPGSVNREMDLIRSASVFAGEPLVPGLAELNGLASRYESSDFSDHAIALYTWGLELYPKDFNFYLSLAGLYSKRSSKKASELLDQAVRLLQTVDADMEDSEAIIEEIREIQEGLKD